ncbi:unnamed protein product [Effrenium voratum]|uniref:Uncharacterized protein n=1 Tax=Effrenium voratum TaxID=2562239 RepID=A0AA36MYH0_9DINO|nr:unnamed protein product [Effrenium voratum]
MCRDDSVAGRAGPSMVRGAAPAELPAPGSGGGRGQLEPGAGGRGGAALRRRAALPARGPRRVPGEAAGGSLGGLFVFAPLERASPWSQVLVDAAAVCEDLVRTTHRLAEAGASGVVFLHSSDGLAGISLGHAEPPPIRAVVVERASGLEAVLVSQVVRAELRQGKLISEEAYEEQFIFRVDEFHATRKENFLWHRYPGMLRSSGRETLSARLMRSLSAPAGWFSRAPAFVPLFNPSVLALQDGSFLVALRMSNGPGCPSVRVSRESSMDTRIFRNELVLAHLDSDFQVKAHVLVEMPPLSCRFAPGTQAGRQFLDEVHGPMDARIAWGEEEIWVFFYAERNRGTSTEVERGMHGAPLRLEWGPCQVWELYRTDKVFAPEQCAWLGSGDKDGLGQCQRSCEAPCNAVNFREGVGCELRRCQEDASQVFHLAGWQSWRQKGPAEGCLRSARVKAEELLAFPAENVEKNWNLIQGQRNRLFLEYFVEPHVVLQAHLQRGDGGIALAGLEQSFVSRWPYEILHGVTNVRGGFCCLRLPLGAGAAGMAAAEPWWDRSQLELPDLPAGVMLGAGHLQRIRSPFDQAPGDVSRFRRQAKSRTYHQFFYLLRDVEPFDVVAVSPEWCITINGHFSQHWAKVLAPGEEACESIQFVAGLALRNWEVVVSYGINDCESDLLTLPLSEVLAMLRPVVSDVNVSLDDLEMI